MKGRWLDVVFSRSKLTVLDGAYLGVFQGARARVSYSIKDYIGVAVHYTPLPRPLPPLGRSFPCLIDRLGAAPVEDAVTLYLLHEERDKDLLLYFATDENEILAQWQFWSQKLGLPQLLVAPDGFVDEPFDRIGGVLFTGAKPRSRRFGLYDRRPIFSRVRDMGDRAAMKAWRGREIMARR